MQSYIKKIVGAKVEGFSTAANLFVYESGTSAGDTRVRVRPETGGEIVLKPGQQFRWPEVIQRWSIETFDGTSTIDGVFILGTGEFVDANTLNKFTLDATFANEVTITNTAAKRVPVTLDPLQVIPSSKSGLTTLSTYAVAAVIGLSAALVSSDATYKRLIFRNASASGNIGLGNSFIAMSITPIILAPGDVWIEDDAAGAPWYAISDTAGSLLQVQWAK